MSIQGQQLKSVLALHQLSFLIKASFDDFCHFRRTVPELQAKLADTAPSAEQQVPAMAVWLLLLDYCLWSSLHGGGGGCSVIMAYSYHIGWYNIAFGLSVAVRFGEWLPN